MGTGAVYVTLSQLQNCPEWIRWLEVVFYFLNVALFILNSLTLILQLILYPQQSKRLLFDPVKGVFVPLMVLSFATIIIGTINYGVPRYIPPNFIYGCFWAYVAFSIIVCFPMLITWFNKPHDISTFTPAWAFLIFPLMLVGVIAFNTLRVIPASDTRAIGVLLIGYVFQGMGFGMTCFYLCIYILRIMQTGFLEGHQANGAFVACGPPGFTALALMELGQSAREILPEHKLISELAGEIWYSGSVMAALLLFGLAVFFFIMALLPYWFKVHKHLSEILGCWALTFPNVGWISTLRILADVFNLRGFMIVHTVMTALLCAVWVVLFFLTGLAFYRGKIFFAKDTDVWEDIKAKAVSHQSPRKQAESDEQPPTNVSTLEKGLR